MSIKVITPPATEPLMADEVRSYGLKADLEDNEVKSLIVQAREECEKQQNRRFITQTLELVLDNFADVVEFRNCSPVQSIVSIKCTLSDGTIADVPIDYFILDTDSFVNRLILKPGFNLPTDLQIANAVRIRFIAGYGNAESVPESVKWAMILTMRLLHDDYRPDELTRLERKRNALLSYDRVVPV